MNKKGFTVAEIFITLMIVGVLTVILAPVIRRSAPDQNKVMFRKTFNTLSQAVSNLSFDDVNYPESDTAPTTDTGQTVSRGFNNQKGSYTEGTKFCLLLANELNTIGSVTCNESVTCKSTTSTWGSFTTADGVDWRISEGPGTVCGRTCTGDDCTKLFPLNRSDHAYQTKIIVDVNGGGADKGPNCSGDNNAASFGLTTCPGYDSICNSGTLPTVPQTPDIYIIGVRYDGNLHLGSGDSYDGTPATDTDKCGSVMLAEPTTNTN